MKQLSTRCGGRRRRISDFKCGASKWAPSSGEGTETLLPRKGVTGPWARCQLHVRASSPRLRMFQAPVLSSASMFEGSAWRPDRDPRGAHKRSPSENLAKVVPRGSPPVVQTGGERCSIRSCLGGEFFEGLLAVDVAIVERATAQSWRYCGGRLHRGDYPHKPRGRLIGQAGESFRRRFSLCCGREGCRRRATPPSVRFLGHRVYVGAVVIVASIVAVMERVASAARRSTGIAARTTRRWLRWWRGPFTATSAPPSRWNQIL